MTQNLGSSPLDSVGLVDVTKADREAAADLFLIEQRGDGKNSPFELGIAAAIRNGERDDSDDVQAFARHRITVTASEPLFTPERIAAAHAETARLERELDIANADHVVLWLAANIGNSSLGWLACRIVEAHEAALSSARGGEK